MMVRTPAVAGMFYPGEPHHLEQLLERFFLGAETAEYAIHMRSWRHTPDTSIRAQSRAVPMRRSRRTSTGLSSWSGPHTGAIRPAPRPSRGRHRSGSSTWTPHSSRRSRSPRTSWTCATSTHSRSRCHSSSTGSPRARIAPVMMGLQDLGLAEALGARMVRAIEETGRDVRMVASSDFSHYVPDRVARSQDLYAIEALADLDLDCFYQRIAERHVSACGYGPIAATCTAAEGRGAKHARLLQYATSGDTTGDTSSVVGYAALAVV